MSIPGILESKYYVNKKSAGKGLPKLPEWGRPAVAFIKSTKDRSH